MTDKRDFVNLPRRVELYDSTLRDGAQAEGISFSLEDKLMIAEKLDDLGITYIEGGWPNETNPKDKAFFKHARDLRLKTSRIVAFGSTKRSSASGKADTTLLDLIEADTEIVTIFGKSWDFHVREVLRISLDENVRLIEDSVKFLVSEGREVFFDAEQFFDGYKANPLYAMKTVLAAQDAGARLIVLCDTNGGSIPEEIGMICDRAAERLTVPLGIHTHNDSGLSSSNTLAAVIHGVTHVQGTINGIGERCGNDNLCTIIPNITLKLGVETLPKANMQMLMEISRFFSEIANEAHNHRQPYVGESAFAHKGGSHIDGVLKNTKSFEHINPELVGNQRRFLLSEQAGGSMVIAKLKKIYPDLDKKSPRVRAVLAELKKKEHEGYQYEAAQGSFELLAARIIEDYKPPFTLGGFRVVTDRRKDGSMVSEATIKLVVDGTEEHTASEGDGPVDALNGALRKALERFYPAIAEVRLEDYKVRVLDTSAGTEAKVRVLIESGDGVEVWGTVGVSENVIEASYIALAESLSYKLVLNKRKTEK